MKFVDTTTMIVNNDNQLKVVEFCARLCYKSEQAITDDSYIKFCKARFSEGHLAIFEHANFIFAIPQSMDFFKLISNLYGVKYVIIEDTIYVNLNLRHIIELAKYENNTDFYNALPEIYKIFEFDIQSQRLSVELISDKNKLDELNLHDFGTFVSVAFNVQRSIWDELARHRANALCCESSRYCNYSKDKFGNEITFSKPHWFNDEGMVEDEALKYYTAEVEKMYFDLIRLGKQPQDARYILPMGYNVNCCLTASLEQWTHIFKLRTSNAAHPDMKKIMLELQNKMKLFYK